MTKCAEKYNTLTACCRSVRGVWYRHVAMLSDDHNVHKSVKTTWNWNAGGSGLTDENIEKNCSLSIILMVIS